MNDKELEKALNAQSDFILDRLLNSEFGTSDRDYYQGRLDQLVEVRRILGHPQILRVN